MGGAEDDKPDGRSPRVWVLAGHKAGDNAQLMALAGALGWPVEVKRLAYRPSELATNLLLRVTLAGLAKGREGLTPPWPDLVLTAGRRNEPVARWIRSQAGPDTKLVHVGRPWAPPDRFDLVIATPQYFVPEAQNVLTVGMPLHGITPAALGEAAAQWRSRLEHLP
ncbi:MAG TPA: ELM1/GtrOC1 family putative glycosyltransferase, partial [Alphaproteobacteria bacterium]|nr:ELM1/GtrOC1 family putative glycosyltransferase [Alphaproteobacteria bacterium]